MHSLNIGVFKEMNFRVHFFKDRAFQALRMEEKSNSNPRELLNQITLEIFSISLNMEIYVLVLLDLGFIQNLNFVFRASAYVLHIP